MARLSVPVPEAGNSYGIIKYNIQIGGPRILPKIEHDSINSLCGCRRRRDHGKLENPLLLFLFLLLL